MSLLAREITYKSLLRFAAPTILSYFFLNNLHVVLSLCHQFDSVLYKDGHVMLVVKDMVEKLILN